MNDTEIAVTIGGERYEGVIVRIDETFLGVEDHGILTAQLHVRSGAMGTAIGGRTLDDKPPTRGAHRPGTAYGMEWIARTMRACGVESWEKVRGRTVLGLWPVGTGGMGHGFECLGIAPLPTDDGEPFLFDDLEVEA